MAPVLLEGDVRAWLVLGYRESRRVLDNPLQFSRDSRIWRDWREGRVEDTSPLIPMLGWRPDCVSQDGEPHRRLRGAVTDGLHAAGRARYPAPRHALREQADRRVRRAGSADLVADYAEYLPMLVAHPAFWVCPRREGRQPGRVSCAQVIKGGEDALAHNDRIMEILGELAERKRSEPGSDFATGALEHHAGLDEDEVVSHLRLVLIAAHTTTSNLLARVLQLVLTDTSWLSRAGQRAAEHLRGRRGSHVEHPAAGGPAGAFRHRGLELGGHQIKEGDLLVLGLAAGNLDPEIRPDVGCLRTRQPVAPRVQRAVRTNAPARTSARPSSRPPSTSCCTGCRACAWPSRRGTHLHRLHLGSPGWTASRSSSPRCTHGRASRRSASRPAGLSHRPGGTRSRHTASRSSTDPRPGRSAVAAGPSFAAAYRPEVSAHS